MRLLNFFRAPPPAKEIQDKAIIRKNYLFWRIRTFYSMYIGYAFFYFSRKSFTFAAPALINDLGLGKAQIGLLASILSITYGLSKFVSGVMSDKSNPRYFMAIGLMLTGVFNIFFGFSSTIVFFALFWGLNGWFQGWGWPPCAKLLTHWYSHSERGTWWSIWNSSHNVGGAIAIYAVTYIAAHFDWRFAMYIPGVFCIVIGFFLINRLRDTPRTLGLPPIEKYRNEPMLDQHNEEKLELSTKEILFEYVLNNKYIWILAISYFFVYVIRMAVNDWTILFFVEEKGYSLLKAGGIVVWFELGGLLGAIVAGWSSDYIFKGRRGPINVLFSALAVIFLIAMWKSPGGYWLIDVFYIFMIGFAIFGPQMLIGVAAAELSHKKAAGTATGFIGTFAYVGAAAAGYPLGKLMQKWGWEGFFIALIVSGCLAFICLAPLWKQKGIKAIRSQEK